MTFHPKKEKEEREKRGFAVKMLLAVAARPRPRPPCQFGKTCVAVAVAQLHSAAVGRAAVGRSERA